MGYAVSLAARARRAAFVYHCMDLHPEIGRLSGEFANPLVYRALARMDRSTMRRASAVVVLSEDMRRSVLDRDPALAPKVVVLNNFDLPERSEPGPAPLPPAEPGVVRVVFTGNLGRFQGLEDAVAAVAALPRDVGVELVLMGQGRARADLEAAARRLPEGTSRVVLLPHGSVADARALMRSAHVGLVSLMPEVVRYAFPSKTSTYAAESLALLVVAEPDSELATTVRRRGLGWAVAPGDVDGLREALVDAARWVSDPAATTTTRADIAAYADGLSQQALLPRWADLVADVLRREQGVA
jgi:glycosyltransferase involved in cell wall biosynthesis